METKGPGSLLFPASKSSGTIVLPFEQEIAFLGKCRNESFEKIMRFLQCIFLPYGNRYAQTAEASQFRSCSLQNTLKTKALFLCYYPTLLF